MENIAHLVLIPFRGVGVMDRFRDDAWYAERIRIFQNYTLKSLQNQINKNFVLWVTFTGRERNHPLTKQLAEIIKATNIPYIFTFNGLPYHDDKFGGTIPKKLKNVGRIIRACYRNNEWKHLIPASLEVFKDKNKSLPERLKRMLDTLRRYFTEANVVLLTRIDSDDMFAEWAIAWIQETAQLYPEYKAIVFKEGYIYNTQTDTIAEWNPVTNPPFHTLRFPATVFFHHATHLAWYGGFTSHEDIYRIAQNVMACTQRGYCVATHQPHNHISTVWNHPFRGSIQDTSILTQFGL